LKIEKQQGEGDETRKKCVAIPAMGPYYPVNERVGATKEEKSIQERGKDAET